MIVDDVIFGGNFRLSRLGAGGEIGVWNSSTPTPRLFLTRNTFIQRDSRGLQMHGHWESNPHPTDILSPISHMLLSETTRQRTDDDG
ncbi:hypothetical protein NHX12_003261 [Muraenolepis orangiensis]|uniref:Uncharacterized protein n=1 Tax=Muraenolepis orangiensis TaxID=630683 RepID=A0A9Q0IH21_9TELE|nr:hypothetical protein NHX12_003261 [Muraenolepis orangiensis]